MNSPLARFARLFMLALMLSMAASARLCAQEDDAGPSVLRDTETELLFKQMSTPLIVAAGLDPNSVKVALLNDPEINAFVATGQTVYVQSGLLEAADNVNQLQGVVAHELGHVVAGDAIRSGQGVKQATGISSFRWSSPRSRSPRAPATREWESCRRASEPRWATSWRSRAPRRRLPTRSGARFLSKAGISGKGMLDFFGKLQNEEYRLRHLFERQLRPRPPAVVRANRGA